MRDVFLVAEVIAIRPLDSGKKKRGRHIRAWIASAEKEVLSNLLSFTFSPGR